MKKFLSILLAVVMLCSVLPTSVWAFDRYVVYSGQAGCQLTNLTFTQANNAWLLWDVTFDSLCDGRVLETAKDHPNLVGRTVIPTFTFEGSSVTFNGVTIESGVTEVELKAENDLIVYSADTRAEYQVSITEETNGLPVVLIDTNDVAIPDKVNYVDATISVLGADTYGGSDIYAATAGIKLRGNSTMSYDKKPYRIKFDSKQNVFGLGKAKSWVLLANYLDPAAMRNDIAYGFATSLKANTAATTGFQVYVPRVRPVEVYLNGEFKGLYDMGDHVQVDGTRIDIDESGDEFDDNDVQLYPEGNVGYYLEVEDPSRVIAEWYSESAYYVTIENSGGTGYGTLYTGGQNADGSLETNGTGQLTTLYVQIKTPEIPSDEQVTYIGDYLQTVNDLILAKDEAVWDYIDMDSFIDWYLANEVFKNTDSGFLSSVKMFKDKDGKLFMGPVWDFDIGSGAVAYSDIDDPTGWRTRVTERCAWYDTLFQMDTFVSAVEARWANIRDKGIVDEIFTNIDNLSTYVAEAAADNYEMWHDSYVTAVNNTSWLSVPDVCLNGKWIENVQYYRNYMTARVQWLDSEFGYGDAAIDYVNLLSASTTASTSQTVTINKTYDVTKLNNIYLSVSSRGAFDITFNFDVGSPSLSSDWQGSDPLLPFQGTTGENIAAGTYTNVELNIDDYIPWSSNPNATTITLESIVIKPSNRRYPVTVSSLYAANEIQADVSATTPLGGKLLLRGVAEYESTLTADTLAITPYGASVNYQWYRDGVAISGATASTYTCTSSDIGTALTVAVTSDNYDGSVTSEPVTIEQSSNDYATTQIPELVSKTHDTIVVAERDNYEISVDGVNWQVSGTFTGLTPNTLYRVQYRHGETTSPVQQPGQPGTALYVITDVDPDAPVVPDPVYTIGDVDNDGDIDTSDAKTILLYVLDNVNNPLDEAGTLAADYNNDGEITTADARDILLSIVSA